MKRFMMRFAIIVSIGLLSLLSLAQDDGMSTFEFEDSDTSIMFPEEWEQSVNEDGVLELATDGVNLMVYDSVSIASLLENEDMESPEELLTAALDTLAISDDIELDAENIKVVELGEREVARLSFETDDSTGSIIALPMDDVSLGLVTFVVDGNQIDDISATVDDVVSSFNTGGSTATGEACTLSTDQSNTVQIRVGPGSNRTVIAFLPAGVGYDALGQTTDGDGNVWFSVPKEEVAPTKAVNETWVAGDSVDQSGDCANVVDALAPPIIPIRQVQPTAVPQVADDGTITESATDTTEADTSDPFAVDADGAFIPVQGNWLEIHNNGTYSCENGRSGTTSPRTGDFTATLSGGGVDGINFNGLFYNYLGNNTYEAYETVLVAGGDYLARLTFTLTSTKTGEGSIGEVFRRCNYFLPITVNYVG